jgi:hypothetical protein
VGLFPRASGKPRKQEAPVKSIFTATGALALIAGTLVSVTLPATPAAAEPWSQTQCEMDGGTYIKDGSNSRCEYPPESSKPGNMPDNYDGGALITTQDTDTGKGNLTNKQETTSTCTGHKCPK